MLICRTPHVTALAPAVGPASTALPKTRTTPEHSPIASLLPIMAVVGVAFLVIGLAMPVLPLHVHHGLGLSTFVVGLVTGSQFAVSLLSRVWAGRFADRCGPKQAVVAGLLTAVGLYGVISFLVARRTHEIGIRMALGADKRHVVSAILRETLMLTVFGIGVGLPITFSVSRLVASMLFGIKPTDPVPLAFAALALCGVSLTAAYIPARRAAAVDPMITLRDE